MNITEIIASISSGILAWYGFNEGERALYIENNDKDWNEALTGFLKDQGLFVQAVPAKETGSYEVGSDGAFDYIIMIGALEMIRDHGEVVSLVSRALKPSGHLLIAIDNRFGFRFFCGDRDPFTGRSFDSIEGYISVDPDKRDRMEGRCLADSDVRKVIEDAGFISKRFSILPSIKLPQLMYAEDYLPTEELGMRYIPAYNHNKSVFLKEQFIYSDLIKNGLFHQMANGYLYDCTRKGMEPSDAEHVTLAMDRGRINSEITIIHGRESVEKRPAYKEGKQKTETIIGNNEYLKDKGISVIDGKNVNGSLVLPFVSAENGMKYFERILKEDKDRFIAELDAFVDIILKSSDHVEAPDPETASGLMPHGLSLSDITDDNGDSGVWLKKGFPDLVPLNAFHTEDGWLFFDQEFSCEPYPAKAVILRTIHIAYAKIHDMEKILPKEFFYERYGLKERLTGWSKFIDGFIYELRKKDVMEPFWQNTTVPWGYLGRNRTSLDHIHLDERKLFFDVLSDIEGKKVFIFGTGKFAGYFWDEYGKDLKLEGFIDNKVEDNIEFQGIKVSSPEILKQYNPETVKVIICIKNYVPVLDQLISMGIDNISIYSHTVSNLQS
ncbi:MAG: class I SAM-dependent methyltransferase [Lachnospiraceae bacterium]|nr:class I SAM-dependent methyltransferase [Lachnospiraceae bacterium]